MCDFFFYLRTREVNYEKLVIGDLLEKQFIDYAKSNLVRFERGKSLSGLCTFVAVKLQLTKLMALKILPCLLSLSWC